MQQVKNLLDNISDSVGISATFKTTLISGLAGIFSGMNQWDWPAIIASTVAIGGLAMNFYFQKRKDRRETAITKAKIEALKRGCHVE